MDREARVADAWWDSLPAERRVQIFGWLNPPDGGHPQVEGQIEIQLPPPDGSSGRNRKGRR